MKQKKVIIYGGSFNPPHIGHMMAIEAALRNVSCDELWVMPSSERLDKKIGVSGKHRVAMLKLSLREFLSRSIPVKIVKLELERPGLTTTFDTKKELEKKYPGNLFYFLIGTDILGDIRDRWVKGEELWNETNFLAIKKPGVKIPPRLPSHIHIIDKDIMWTHVSSTNVRHLIGEGHSGIPYIHPRVADYIKKNRLYKI